MKTDNTFLIESERSRHRLFLDARELSSFNTLEAAEAEAKKIVAYLVPGASLRFELDFKWILSDLEMRVATLRYETNSQASQKEVPSCGS
jgi:hypothetical protein